MQGTLVNALEIYLLPPFHRPLAVYRSSSCRRSIRHDRYEGVISELKVGSTSIRVCPRSLFQKYGKVGLRRESCNFVKDLCPLVKPREKIHRLKIYAI